MSYAGLRAAPQLFYEMKKAGRIPADVDSARVFWRKIMRHAEKTKDVELYAECMAKLKEVSRDDARTKKFLAGYEQKLKELREEHAQQAPAPGKSR